MGQLYIVSTSDFGMNTMYRWSMIAGPERQDLGFNFASHLGHTHDNSFRLIPVYTIAILQHSCSHPDWCPLRELIYFGVARIFNSSTAMTWTNFHTLNLSGLGTSLSRNLSGLSTTARMARRDQASNFRSCPCGSSSPDKAPILSGLTTVTT